MKNLNIFICVLVLFMAGCKTNSKERTEKFQKQRDKVIYVGDKIKDIKTDVIFGDCDLTIIDDILIVNEIRPSSKKIMHLFNKNTFEYITSAGFIGRGPGEISRYGTIAKDRNNRAFWYSDYDRCFFLGCIYP